MEAEIFKHSLQAASPDEIALVEWTTKMGLALIERSNSSIKLKTDSGRVMSFTIMQIFPFTSEAKRMGIILRVSHFVDLRCPQISILTFIPFHLFGFGMSLLIYQLKLMTNTKGRLIFASKP